MRLEQSVTLARAGKRLRDLEKRRAAFHATTVLHAHIEDKAKPARRNTTVISLRSKPPVIAIAQGLTAPVAVNVDGCLVGLALKVGGSFVFFSAGHRSDHCDGKVFASLAAIREATDEIPAAPSEVCEAAGV